MDLDSLKSEPVGEDVVVPSELVGALADTVEGRALSTRPVYVVRVQ